MHLQAKECQRTAMSHQSGEEATKDSFLEPSEGTWPCQNLISDFWPLDYDKQISGLLSYKVCVNLI